ncbi:MULTISPECIES: hypothetical protein [unclassified Streptomyces]|uniref:hypothetical protein n=1 Tax=unclassified Streptomyces TaxID=2593676 RepID=UPI000882A83F|nr:MULTISPECIES: hypothetical protein [unclassified Streptomyces]PBC72352.1 hypothetical protein BX261_7437 [Streptomyces sp. 2321.6]SDR62070.1 hypothetical protein SAMN05216511_7266 [Streptomyces sp. KS_16]SEE50012.1 hypothetical protein SAMN05428940_7315 [Streptomyces sp. 2133.1]SNC77856.1 hypothetical protein SAMN06272741_7273 [Streptomyces sp. 2114.4]
MATTSQPKTLDLLRIATSLVTENIRHGSPSMLMRRINQDHGISIGFETARALLIDLYAAGIVAAVDRKTHAYPVLLERQAALTALESYVGSGTTDRQTLYECPQCSRVAAWTDGRKVSAGDEVDEFWCQTCGAEVPLSGCTIVSTA